MIDLNALEKFTDCLQTEIKNDSMPLPSPKDVLILNDELIDNYTGNGITKRGNVKIDENGIASGFSNSSIHHFVSQKLFKNFIKLFSKNANNIYKKHAF